MATFIAATLSTMVTGASATAAMARLSRRRKAWSGGYKGKVSLGNLRQFSSSYPRAFHNLRCSRTAESELGRHHLVSAIPFQ
ncbi:hypothetical protein B0H67DRAFT_572541 [Lasiosphaeris hirsuta]|uniref:Secreted protein n=1 Tax=Lasiosphaeris hirsuta TaxID=260670 RepID=A0AA40ANK1_9PEZI|nr:hypothetical protein B0H67DRAFT_572541 [Lasiosphaeris hirsuta]